MSRLSRDSEVRSARVEVGLLSLVDKHFPLPREGDRDHGDRDRENHRHGLELVNSILQR